jgi:hypothetical protein
MSGHEQASAYDFFRFITVRPGTPDPPADSVWTSARFGSIVPATRLKLITPR